jgi:hypothetical protein
LRSLRMRLFVLAAATLTIVGPVVRAAPTYYISPTGNDSADGRTPRTAWRSVSKANQADFAPGTTVLFQAGGVWRDPLMPHSDGTAAHPIVFGEYGKGPKPQFSGSNPLPNSQFQLMPGSTSVYMLPVASTVNSVLENNTFLHSSYLLLNLNADPAANLAYVGSTPNSWFYNNGTLYLNTGRNPQSDGHNYAAAVRDNMIYASTRRNLIFRDLVAEDTARYASGYAFRVDYSTNITLQDCEAYRAGKHHFAVIDSTGFVGRGLLAQQAMPDQGSGGATAFVAYSDGSRHDTSAWINSTARDMGGNYPAFYSHGSGIGSILITNMKAFGASISPANVDNPAATIRVLGGQIVNSSLDLATTKAVVDGVRISGPEGRINVAGSANLIQHVQLTGTKPVSSYQGAVVVTGDNNTIRFNTIAMDPTTPAYTGALAFHGTTSGTSFYGNTVTTAGFAVNSYVPLQDLRSFGNRYTGPQQFLLPGQQLDTAQWRALGYDRNSTFIAPRKVDRGPSPSALAGQLDAPALDISLIPGDVFATPALSLLPDNLATGAPAANISVDTPVVPEPTTGLSLIALLPFIALRKRRSVSPCLRRT